MKNFKDFLNEATPTNSGNAAGGEGGFGSDATASGAVSGFDKFLFPSYDDDLSQDYQTPGESGLSKWRWSNVWPVQKLNMDQINSMVGASKEFVDLMDKDNQQRVRKNFTRFMGYTR